MRSAHPVTARLMSSASHCTITLPAFAERKMNQHTAPHFKTVMVILIISYGRRRNYYSVLAPPQRAELSSSLFGEQTGILEIDILMLFPHQQCHPCSNCSPLFNKLLIFSDFAGAELCLQKNQHFLALPQGRHTSIQHANTVKVV